jgi:hypothetical protein
MKHLLSLGAAALALALCAPAASAQTDTTAADTSHAAAPGDTAHQQARRPRRNRNQITAEEIAEAHVSTAWDAVSRLRPAWLHNRGGAAEDTDGSVEVQVYHNGVHDGDVQSLKQYAATDIQIIQYVDPITARTRFGRGHGRGVIMVTERH